MKVSYNQRIKERRESKGFTQKKLAELASIAPGSLSAYENGNKTPPVDVAARIAKALEVSLDWLFGMESEETMSQSPKTYADLIKLFLLIAETFPMVYPGVTNNDAWFDSRIDALKEHNSKASPKELSNMMAEYNYGSGHTSYASMEIPDRTVVGFFQSWKKFYDLRKDGTLDDEIYNAWINKRLTELAQVPLRYSWSDPDTSVTPEQSKD